MFGAYAQNFSFRETLNLFEQVHGGRTDKAGYKGAGWTAVNLLRCAKLLHAACVHHNHSLRQRHGFDLVVGNKEAGDAQFAV